MTGSFSIRKASCRFFATLTAIMLAILCLANTGILTVKAATKPKATVEPILSGFDRYYPNYYNTVNKYWGNKLPQNDTTVRILGLFLRSCDVDYQLTYKSSDRFAVSLPDLTCDVVLNSSYDGGINMRVGDIDNKYVAIICRGSTSASIRLVNGDIETRSLVINKDNHNKASSDVATLLTVIGCYYKPKTSVIPQTGIDNNEDLAAYLGSYIVNHGKEAAKIREEIIETVEVKNIVTEADFKDYYTSKQSGKFTDILIDGSTRTQWSICPGLTISRSNTYGPGGISDTLTVSRWDWMSEYSNPTITAKFTNNRIEIKCGEQIKKTVICSPSEKLAIEFENGEFVDSDTITLGIMLDRALYEYALAEGMY